MKTSRSLLLVLLASAYTGNTFATFLDATVETKRNNQRVCADNPDFTFTLINNDVVECNWIDQNKDPAITEKRRNKWCDKNQIVASNCSQSCGYCEDYEQCRDDTTFRFKIRSGTIVNCAWIDENGIKDSQRRNRLNRWCNEKTTNIVNYCPKSCDKCGDIPPSPTPSAPTPSAPTPTPPSNCKDDANFRFKIRSGKTVNCAWIDENGIKDSQRNNRLNRWCNEKTTDIINYCPKSCGKTNCDDVQPSPTPPAPTSSENTALERKMLNLINAERAKAGVAPLCFNSKLNAAALSHSMDMRNNEFFDHKGSDGTFPKDRIIAQGYTSFTRGENIATDTTVESAHQLLMESQGHRENLLYGSYAHIGIGIATYKQNTDYDFSGYLIITQNFANSRDPNEGCK